MKRTLLFLLTALFAGMPLLKAETIDTEAKSVVLNRQYDLKNFQGVSAGNVFHVVVVQDSKWSVEVEYSDFLEPYLEVSLSGGTLNLDLERVPKSLQRSRRFKDERVLKATVHMPRLDRVSVSGAANLRAEGLFKPAGDEFRMSVSGAAVADGLAVEAREARLVLSGAAKCPAFKGEFRKIDLDVSGAARGGFEVSADEWDVVLSGSAKAALRGRKSRKIELETSGASKATLEIPSAELSYEGTGASSLQALDAPAGDAEIELSGSASCRITVQDRLEVEASGASSCRYKVQGGGLKVKDVTAARGASVKEI